MENENIENETPKVGRPKKFRFLPYEGPDSLPKPEVKIKKGKDGKEYPVVQRLGAPRFKIVGNKLKAYYRKPQGIAVKLFKVFRMKNPADKSFRAKLKEAGIPGA